MALVLRNFESLRSGTIGTQQADLKPKSTTRHIYSNTSGNYQLIIRIYTLNTTNISLSPSLSSTSGCLEALKRA